jgi:hypothetical protein
LALAGWKCWKLRETEKQLAANELCMKREGWPLVSEIEKKEMKE